MKLLTFFTFFLYTTLSYAQKYSVDDKKAIDLFEKALALYNIGQLENSKTVAQKALERNHRFIEVYLLLADIFNEQKKITEEIKMLKKVIEIKPDFNEKIHLMLAKALYKLEKFDEASKHINTFLEKGQVHHEIKEAKKLKEKIEFAKYAYNNPVPFNPVRLSTNINSPYKDYWPSLTIDEKELYYTIALPTNARSPFGDIIYQEDIFVSKKNSKGEWQMSEKLGKNINTEDNEGSQSISANGMYLFYVACNRKSDFGSCDIYISERTETGWTTPQNIGRPVNSEYWESTPASSADGRILFFSSNRPGTKGGKDLFVSYKNNDGTWSEPKNMGDSINTPGNEYAPFLHPDGKTLYFSSDGWLGLGGQDIFVSKMKDDSTWTTPKNLGYPINTSSDDFGLIVNATGQYAYFSSNREGSQDWDLYTFELYETVRPEPVIYLTGKIYDIKTETPVIAKIELFELENKILIYQAKSYANSGNYLACIPQKKQYAMNVEAKGYLFFSEHFSLEKLKKIEQSFVMDVPLKPIELGTTIILKNIFYETDKYNLKPESEVELNKLAQFLINNPKISIEISGHTDNVGTAEYNKILSTNRAKTVYEYLISKGIPANRLKYAGYGFSKPIASNDTDEGKALNRRTEFKIIGIN